MNETKREQRDRRRAGFTLIEIMLVVVIIGVLAAVVAVNTTWQGKMARINATRASIQNIGTAVQLYEQESGRWPTSLGELTVATQHRPGLLQANNLKDSWGVDFQFKMKNEFEYEIRSAGPDGQMGTEDDVTN
jgi:general secretion pathway protein G